MSKGKWAPDVQSIITLVKWYGYLVHLLHSEGKVRLGSHDGCICKPCGPFGRFYTKILFDK